MRPRLWRDNLFSAAAKTSEKPIWSSFNAVCGVQRPCHTPQTALNGLQIGFSEVCAAAEKRLSRQSRGRISEAVAKIQSGWMAPLAESRIRVDGPLPMKIAERYDLDPGLLEKAEQRSRGVLPEAGRQDQTGFGSGRRSDAGEVRIKDRR